MAFQITLKFSVKVCQCRNCIVRWCCWSHYKCSDIIIYPKQPHSTVNAIVLQMIVINRLFLTVVLNAIKYCVMSSLCYHELYPLEVTSYILGYQTIVTEEMVRTESVVA